MQTKLRSAIMIISFKDHPSTVIGYIGTEKFAKLKTTLQLICGVHTPAEWGVSPPLADIRIVKYFDGDSAEKLNEVVKEYAKEHELPFYLFNKYGGKYL